MKALFLALLLIPLTGCTRTKAIEGEKVFQYEGGLHQPGRQTYKETPPVGGVHNSIWQHCGVYDRPIYNEHAVHSMEHGAVWVTYRPDLSQDDLATLNKLVDGRTYTLLSPYPGLPTPVVISAWNRQLQVNRADDPRLKRFLNTYELGKQAPESGSPCVGDASTSETQ
ncbi:hypothetical protein GCM10008956_04340 [Deinococcus arenae]|uniref:DUF3105 domain-containing protein n=1 Tax=Deinococcus arenae TaxID=1452751 RepID=A0A8H9GII6_9DEIO|nr:DUF3105 domain-containing protein [Deinococcus arenae]AWT35841.1 hypothetical protein DM785_09930 [Deinococcus actinosclerus]GGM31356.1 hypothetical protein GCM10008956_04340 [Deinococcus arenae]